MQPVKTKPGPDIYVSGTTIETSPTADAANNVATYWKNGVEIHLAPSEDSTKATGIVISGKDIYVSGSKMINGILNAVYWKNGNLVVLGKGAATSIVVVGNDVYVGGYTNVWARSANMYQELATYWKNGSAVLLPTIKSVYSYEIYHSMINAIAVSGGDVYTVGESTDIGGDFVVASFWKNSSGIPLVAVNPAGGTDRTLATGIVVQDNDIYISGYDESSSLDNPINYTRGAIYWKNGSVFSIATAAGNQSYALALSDKGICVAIRTDPAGTAGAYWMNNIFVSLSVNINPLPNRGIITQPTGMVAVGDDIYVSGYIFEQGPLQFGPEFPTYWKNGKAVTLPTAIDGEASGIAVVAAGE